MAVAKSVPVVFDHYKVPEGVQGSFKAKCKHCLAQILFSESPNMQDV